MTDFPVTEFEARLARLQKSMHRGNLDAILLCTEPDFRYFSGFRTLFWQSPTRPWYLILPAHGEPIAVIPGIGLALMQSTWVTDVRTWSSPNPEDEGVTLLIAALQPYSRIGLPMGPESSLRMPLQDFTRLQNSVGAGFYDATPLIKALRMVKSPAELAILQKICGIASQAFDQAGNLFSVGQPLSEVFRQFKIALLTAGAEDVPYLVGASAQGGYSDVISPPGPDPLTPGDVLMLDTGATLQGYYCDFDRNFGISYAGDAAKYAHQSLWQATEAALKVARPGVTCQQLFSTMHQALGAGHSDVGRYGHGLGIQLTEWPSIAAFDQTELQPGMVITLEPSLTYGPGQMMVHEENILITEGTPELLTKRAPPDLPVI